MTATYHAAGAALTGAQLTGATHLLIEMSAAEAEVTTAEALDIWRDLAPGETFVVKAVYWREEIFKTPLEIATDTAVKHFGEKTPALLALAQHAILDGITTYLTQLSPARDVIGLLVDAWDGQYPQKNVDQFIEAWANYFTHGTPVPEEFK